MDVQDFAESIMDHNLSEKAQNVLVVNDINDCSKFLNINVKTLYYTEQGFNKTKKELLLFQDILRKEIEELKNNQNSISNTTKEYSYEKNIKKRKINNIADPSTEKKFQKLSSDLEGIQKRRKNIIKPAQNIHPKFKKSYCPKALSDGSVMTSAEHLITKEEESVESKNDKYDEFIRFINKSDLSVRAISIISAKCNSIEDCYQLNRTSLLCYRNCGTKTANEIVEFFSLMKKSVNCIAPPQSTKDLLSQPPDKKSISLLPLFCSKKLEGITVKDLHPNFQSSIKLKDLVLSTRTSNVLNDLKMTTIGEVMLMPEDELLRVQNFGKKTLAELKEKVLSLCRTTKTLNDHIGDDTFCIDYKSYEKMLSSFIRQCEKNKRNQELLIQRFCFEGYKIPTLDELGYNFGITRQRVRQILIQDLKKIKVKANLNKLFTFWETLDSVVAHGGGMISLWELPTILKNEFNWPTSPNYKALGQLLLLRQPNAKLTDKNDIFVAETECINCELPLQYLFSLYFDTTESFHIQVVGTKLKEFCKKKCPWNKAPGIFHKAFIQHIITKTKGHFVLYGNIVLSHDKWNEKYCEKLEDVACHILEKHGKPMHFTEIASGIREKNIKFNAISDHNLHSAIMRYSSIKISDRGIYGLTSWGLEEYRTVSKAIEELLNKTKIPQKRQSILQALNSEYSEGNITTSLYNENKFKNIGEGFYDTLNNWKRQNCQDFIKLMPEPVAELAQYLVTKNNTSYKMVMAYIFIRSMNKDGKIYLNLLKKMFYNFYLSRHKKGLIVESETSVLFNIDQISANQIINSACSKPLISFYNSGFFIKDPQYDILIAIRKKLATEIYKNSVRDLLLITMLKGIDDYYQTIIPITVEYKQKNKESHKISEASSPSVETNIKNETPSSQVPSPAISIKKIRRGKIKL